MSQTKVLSALPAGSANPVPQKGRSKLASRHNRRKKRRDRGDKQSLSSSGVKRNADRVPIPSFTPIADEYKDGVVVRSGSSACELGAEPACPHETVEEDATNADATEGGAGTHANSTTLKRGPLHSDDASACIGDKLVAREQLCAKRQKVGQGADELVHGNDKGQSAPDREVSSELAGMAPKAPHQLSSYTAAKNDSPAMQMGGIAGDTRSEKGAPPEGIAPPENAESEKGKSSPPDEGRRSPQVQQSDQELHSKAGGYIKDVHAKSKSNRSDTAHSKPEPPEVIQLLDDDADAEEAAKPKAKKEPSKKKEAAKKRKPPKAGKRKVAPSSDGDELACEAKPAKKRQRKATQRKQTAAKAEEGKSKKQTKAASSKKLCFACSSCKCNARAGTESSPQKFPALSGSDARQEQSLVNRLQRVERDIAWKEGQRNDVARQLQRHRTQMEKKWEGQNASTKANRPRFLADADASDELECSQTKICFEEVERAKCKIFGRQNTKQVTLTQMIGGPKQDDADDDEDPPAASTKQEPNGTPDTAKKSNVQGEVGSSTSPGDFLSFWAESAPDEEESECVGTLTELNHALEASKIIKSTGAWAKATANSLQVKEEEGFEALVDLFDESMDQGGGTGCSQEPADDDDCMIDTSPARALSPCAKGVASDIHSSVKKNPQKREAIERVCPNWQENVDLTQAQAFPDDVANALQNVQQAQADLEKMKDRILQAFNDRKQTLELYQRSLQHAKERLSEKEEFN
ncbi:hypothetical protein ACHAXT_010314 [Thalassiosira profunda]